MLSVSTRPQDGKVISPVKSVDFLCGENQVHGVVESGVTCIRWSYLEWTLEAPGQSLCPNPDQTNGIYFIHLHSSPNCMPNFSD